MANGQEEVAAPKRRLSAAIRFAHTSPAASTDSSVKGNAPENRDIFSIANAETTKCSEESPSFHSGGL